MARPTELTPENQAAILQLIRRGDFPEIAVSMCGIDPSTYYRWMKRAKTGEEPFCQFRKEVQAARNEARSYLRGLILRGAEEKDPKLACWLLERMDKRYQVQRQPANDARLQAPTEKLTDAELEAKLEQTVRQASEQLAALKSIREQSPRADERH